MADPTCHDLPVNAEAHREIAAIHAGQSTRAAFVAILVIVAGTIGTFAAASALATQPGQRDTDPAIYLAVFAAGAILTALAYLLASAVGAKARAQATAHLAATLTDPEDSV